jgi:hypothetical protein
MALTIAAHIVIAEVIAHDNNDVGVPLLTMGLRQRKKHSSTYYRCTISLYLHP